MDPSVDVSSQVQTRSRGACYPSASTVLFSASAFHEAARRPAGRPHKDCRWCYSRARSLLQELLPTIDIYDAVRS